MLARNYMHNTKNLQPLRQQKKSRSMRMPLTIITKITCQMLTITNMAQSEQMAAGTSATSIRHTHLEMR